MNGAILIYDQLANNRHQELMAAARRQRLARQCQLEARRARQARRSSEVR